MESFLTFTSSLLLRPLLRLRIQQTRRLQTIGLLRLLPCLLLTLTIHASVTLLRETLSLSLLLPLLSCTIILVLTQLPLPLVPALLLLSARVAVHGISWRRLI